MHTYIYTHRSYTTDTPLILIHVQKSNDIRVVHLPEDLDLPSEHL